MKKIYAIAAAAIGELNVYDFVAFPAAGSFELPENLGWL